MKKNIFQNLFVLDLANNHFGDLNHAKKIINKFNIICKKKKINFVVKFQFRNLETYLHKSALKDQNNKYVKRFNSTKLSLLDIKSLVNFCKTKKILTACTPFDEESVHLIEKLKIDIVKVASVSGNDFSLLSRVVKNKLPKIISTGGLQLNQIDKIVSFMKHRAQNFAIMHCVALYPTANKNMNLAFIKNLIERYSNITIGWSTHEDPKDFLPMTIAYSCGARMFEKHIGISTKKYKLNNYSIEPTDFETYLNKFLKVKEAFGLFEKKITKEEYKTIFSLQRGVYFKNDMNQNKEITKKDIYFAFPKKKDQLGPDEFTDNTKLNVKVKKDGPLLRKNLKKSINEKNKHREILKESVHQVKAILNYNKIEIGSNFDLEISHHYGIKNFRKTGCFLFNVINKDYCKKILVMLPKQKHPLHFHKRKEETFHILAGKLVSILAGKKHIMYPGDLIDVKPGTWHEFYTLQESCIFEEVSTTSYKDDSFYQDSKIQSLQRDKRKTYVKSWGRFEI